MGRELLARDQVPKSLLIARCHFEVLGKVRLCPAEQKAVKDRMWGLFP